MNFKEAKSKLKKLAKGEYHSIQYGITEYLPNKLKQKCSVYIDGYSWHWGETWKVALKSLENEMNLPPKKPVKIESI